MSQPDIRLDVPYGTAASATLLLDVYQSPQSTQDSGRPAIVLVHGGGWFRGDKAKETTLASLLVDAGYLVFVPNYRLAPDHVFPAGRDDVLSAAHWAKDSEYAFDRDRMAFVGGSAGGNLVVEAAIATGCPAVSWSGIFDLEGIIRSTDATAAAPTAQDLDAMRSADINQTGRDDAFLRWVILQEVGGDRLRLPDATTTTRVTASTGPVYLANSLAEFVPVTDPAALQHALAAVGVASTLQLIPSTRHAEGYLADALPGSLAFLAEALDLRAPSAPA
ncbi:alpha/beta hydrolase [Herbiconiux ginsengi]|uniref:Acetyl esterase/lipase n=1 Tax=Herbiconiux ginsengi TaxID=381665 RepID=A0A1H3RMB9_9MICO|nr:alpha/beta hydrolase [Herbiconiux ginsengi]SDZ26763.1 Acetyl esterase/lipase [Herbiconiux ginsengi]